MSQPETGALISEYELNGGVHRTIGRLRPTGHEGDPELHLALNSSLPLVDPAGGFFFVFQTGEPVLRKYDAAGQLVFERRIQGREIDADDTHRGDRFRSHLWIAFTVPYTYVFDRDGDKIRTVQFRAAGIVTPSSLFFARNGRIFLTPGLFEFAP